MNSTTKYIAYYSDIDESKEFESHEQALEWLEEAWEHDLVCWGMYNDSTLSGLDTITKVTAEIEVCKPRCY